MSQTDTAPRFHNKNGDLTTYALACGYVEKYEVRYETTIGSAGIGGLIDPRDHESVTLWHEGVYHVRHHDSRVTDLQPGHHVRGRIVWDSFESVVEARKAFKRIRREIIARNAR